MRLIKHPDTGQNHFTLALVGGGEFSWSFFARLCYACAMIAVNAHFDGKVIVPDEPLSLKPDQKLRISIEMIDAEQANPRTDWHALIGIANQGPTNPSPRFPDQDSLWEGTLGNHLENGPNKERR